MTDEVKGQAEHLSKLNDVRVAVLDLYKGKIGVDAEEASHVSSAPVSTNVSRVSSAIATLQRIFCRKSCTSVMVAFEHRHPGEVHEVYSKNDGGIFSTLVQLMENLDFKQAVDEITTAAKWLRENGASKVTFRLPTLSCRFHLQSSMILKQNAERFWLAFGVQSNACVQLRRLASQGSAWEGL